MEKETKLRMSPNYWTFYSYEEGDSSISFKRTEGKNGKVKHKSSIDFETVLEAKNYFEEL